MYLNLLALALLSQLGYLNYNSLANKLVVMNISRRYGTLPDPLLTKLIKMLRANTWCNYIVVLNRTCRRRKQWKLEPRECSDDCAASETRDTYVRAGAQG
jgi:hypothetical protein